MIQLLLDYGIPFQTEGHKHCRPGWANMACPFCVGNPGLHLGVNMQSGVFFCWRCGWKPATKAVAGLLGLSEGQAKEVLKEYKQASPALYTARKKAIALKPYQLPSPHFKIDSTAAKPHFRYLEKRGYDPEQIAAQWGLVCSGPFCFLNGKPYYDYSYRIIAPILWKGRAVSFQARDITNKSDLKYKACPEQYEKVHHKHILYLTSASVRSGFCICVEGITDAWRLGEYAAATFGVKFTTKQVRALARMFERVVILFDSDVAGQTQAKQLEIQLKINHRIKVRREYVEGDPGGLSQKDADYLVKDFLKWSKK